MRPATFFDTVRFYADGVKIVEKHGLTIELGDDFGEFARICGKLKGRVSEHFDPKYMDLLSERAVWMACYTSKGKIAAVQAIRCDDLGSATLEKFLQSQLPRINGGIPKVVSPGPRQLTGRVVYHGELFLSDSFRKTQLGPCLIRLAQAEAMLRWQPSAIYGLTNKELVLKGFNMRKAYAHCHPHAIEWEELPPGYNPTYFLIWNEWEDLEWMVRAGHEAYVAGLGKQQTPEVVRLAQQAG